jgi:hypothetical protein
MNGGGKSDSLVVAEKPSNKGWGAPRSAEKVEPRRLTKSNLLRQNRSRTQRRAGREYGQL